MSTAETETRTGSGRILVRLPRTLHAELVDQAEQEGVSLNQFIVAALAGATGWRHDRASTETNRLVDLRGALPNP
jgi:hypothetical protein